MSVTFVAPAPRSRLRPLAATVLPTSRVIKWQPVAAAGVSAVALVAIGNTAQVPLRLSIAGACLAASAAYMIDDPGAVTVASSPTALFARRAVRTVAAVAGAGVGWVTALLASSLRVDTIAVWPATLQVATLLVVGLAVSAIAAGIGGGTNGAIAGVVAALMCFGSTFLPGPSWLPFPPDPTAPGATERLLLILGAAAAVLEFASRDPAAAIRRPIRRNQHRDHKPGGTDGNEQSRA